MVYGTPNQNQRIVHFRWASGYSPLASRPTHLRRIRDCSVWGTILIDIYRQAETSDLHAALEDLCSPFDNWDFSSAGVYCYWHPRDRESLYVGLARDIPERFAQHGGLIRFLETGCKVRQIRAHFGGEEELGFSAVVQSPLSQPITHRQLARAGKRWSDIDSADRAWSEAQIDNLRRLEGGLLKVYQLRHGRLPAWNAIGGLREGARMANADDNVLDLISGRADSLLVARRPLRELSARPLLAWLENWLHSARIAAVAQCLIGDIPITDARIQAEIARLGETMKERENLDKLGYLQRHPLDGGPPIDMTLFDDA